MTMIINSTGYRLEHPIMAFKFAPRGQSKYYPDQRAQVEGWDYDEYDPTSKGEVVFYKMGMESVSPSGPGMMVYRDPPMSSFVFDGLSWMIVHVKSGTYARHGVDTKGRRIMCVSHLTPVGWLYAKDAFLLPGESIADRDRVNSTPR